MKRHVIYSLGLAAVALLGSGCGRNIRTAVDVTPGNPKESVLDWRYGANDIRIQTTKLNRQLVDRWFAKTSYRIDKHNRKPRLIFTEIDNRTDMFIPTDMIRDIIEGVSVNDGRYSVIVGDSSDREELDAMLRELVTDSKYSNSSRPEYGAAKAPQFLAKLRLTKAVTQQRRYDLEDYRMTVTLYDIESGEVVDSAWDVLQKRVKV